MGSQTVIAGVDTFAGSAYPTLTHGDDKYLRLKTAANRAFIYLKSPAPRGATIISATLTVHARGASTGSRTLTAQRVGVSWKASKLDWANQPGVVGGTAATSIGTVADGDTISFDVASHLQTIANGAPNYGWRIISDAATLHLIYGLNAGKFKPTLTVTWSDKPDAPTTLVPSGVVASNKPLLSFDYTDVSGSMDLQSIQVQIDAGNNFVSGIDFDSGTVTSTVPELDLTTTAYAGLANAATTYWRARVQDAAGLWSDWSDVHSFTRQDLGAVTITNPAAPSSNYVLEATPELAWTFSGTQTAWRLFIRDAADTTVILHDSGKTTDTATTYTLPKGILHDGTSYVIEVRVWDNVANRVHPLYARATRTFTMNEDVGVTAPSSLTVAQDGTSPRVVLTWTRGTFPDSWTILRDGKVIEALIDPADTLVTGTTHSWTDWGASPEKSHSYAVRAIVNHAASAKSNVPTITTHPVGIWLLDEDHNLSFVMLGRDGNGWSSPDQASTYRAAGSSKTVRRTSSVGAKEGNESGILLDATGYPARVDQVTALYAMKSRPATAVRLVKADQSFLVVLGDVVDYPTADGTTGDVVTAVEFAFWQVGQIPFAAVL